MEEKVRQRSRTGRGRAKQPILCHCCVKEFVFCWTCRCGFAMCQACMNENLWGVTCNNIIWQCPDCGNWNGFGNQ
ncbi:MAG: hypothetical protein QMD09_13230 [Desulfatibacillaceae bacterium]|nr:hypothetical protein [Desulfatibacillaceae bacterium]